MVLKAEWLKEAVTRPMVVRVGLEPIMQVLEVPEVLEVLEVLAERRIKAGLLTTIVIMGFKGRTAM